MSCRICRHPRRAALELEGAVAMRAPEPDLALVAVASLYRVSVATLAEHVGSHARAEDATDPYDDIEPNPDHGQAARAYGCRCCRHIRRGDLEREGKGAASVDELGHIAGRFGVTFIGLRRHLEHHDSVTAAIAARTNVETLRVVIETAVDARDVALELLTVLAGDRAATAALVARLTIAPPSSLPTESTTRPRLARARPRTTAAVVEDLDHEVVTKRDERSA